MVHPTTHHVTHKATGTAADIRISPGVQINLQSETPSTRRKAEDHVAIAFKHTTPIKGPDLSSRRVRYEDLRVLSTEPGDDGEPHIPMDGHGDPIGDESD